MELSGYVGIFRRWFRTLLAATIISGGIAYLVASQVPPLYEAEAQLLVGPINTDQNTLEASQALVQTYAVLVTTATVLQAAIDDLDLNTTPEILRESTTARADNVTRLLTIGVEAGNPEAAAATANALAAGVAELASREQVRPEGEISLINPAVPSPLSIEPTVALTVALAAAASLIAVLALVLLVEFFENTIRGRDDLNELSQAPFLGAVPAVRRFRPGPIQPLVVEARPDSRAALVYKLMATKITAGDWPDQLHTLVVIGAEGQEGSGEVAANLASALSRAGRSVRLVDANEEHHEIMRLFGARTNQGSPGLPRDGDKVLTSTTHPLPPGMELLSYPSSPGPRVVDYQQAREVLDRLISDVDLVILSVAPIQRAASALIWTRVSDAAILVARVDKTKRQSITFSVESLRLLGTPLIGTVLHGAGTRIGSGDPLETEGTRPLSRTQLTTDKESASKRKSVRPHGVSE